MRIAFLALHFAEYASRLALPLARDNDVLLILSADNAEQELSPEFLQRLRSTMRLRLIRIPRFRNPKVLRAIAEVRRAISEHQPDIVHVQEFHQAFTGPPILTMRRKVPVIITVHDALPHSGSLNSEGWRWRVVQWFRRQCSRMIVHGPSNQRDLETMNHGVNGRVDIVPHGILGRDTVDDSLSEHEPDTFLFFGRIEQYKGLEYLLDAQELLRRKGRRCKLIIAGRGVDLERLRTRVLQTADIELLDRFIPGDELPALFRRALAVTLPYTDATQSGVSAMAFAYARPVIATRVGDVPEVVIDGETGLVVPPRNAAELARAMERLMNDEALRDKLALGAACMARDGLSWDRIAEQTQQVYHRALQSHAATC
jgi:glycosyltransferase involved in cell wall biosynthesis